MKYLFLNGPNLHLLGQPQYSGIGAYTLADIEAKVREHALSLQVELDFKQSNSLSQLAVWIKEAKGVYDGLILNLASYTFVSESIAGALKDAGLPTIDVRLTAPFLERTMSTLPPYFEYCTAQISGFGITSYIMALDGAVSLTKTRNP